ncbi:hypothetical protein V6N13_029312 [Hibiscus sabdariffa]
MELFLTISFTCNAFFSSLLNSKPIFKTSHMYVLLVRNWSAAMCGQHRKGTPLVKPSVVEFHPQRLTKHETDKRANTISCGVHSAIFLPFQCLEFWNPFGNFAVYTSMKSGLSN